MLRFLALGLEAPLVNDLVQAQVLTKETVLASTNLADTTLSGEEIDMGTLAVTPAGIQEVPQVTIEETTQATIIQAATQVATQAVIQAAIKVVTTDGRQVLHSSLTLIDDTKHHTGRTVTSKISAGTLNIRTSRFVICSWSLTETTRTL